MIVACPGLYHFHAFGFLPTDGFELRFRTYTSNHNYYIDTAFSEMLPPASNEPRCGVLAAKTKAIAGTYEKPTTYLSECHVRFIYRTNGNCT